MSSKKTAGENRNGVNLSESASVSFLVRATIDPTLGFARSPSSLGQPVRGVGMDMDVALAFARWGCADPKNTNRNGCGLGDGTGLGRSLSKNIDSKYIDQAMLWAKKGDNLDVDPVDRKVGLLGISFDERDVRRELALWGAAFKILESASDVYHRDLIFETAKAETAKFSTEEKIRLAAMLGGIFAQGYDKRRASVDERAMGVVDAGVILNAANRRMQLSILNKSESGKVLNAQYLKISDQEYAGVCRDIAATQAELLQAAGLESYVLTTSQGLGGHALVIARDAKVKNGEIFQINYGTTRKFSGNDLYDPQILLSRSWEKGFSADHSTAYNLYRPTSGFASKTRTEFGKIVQEMSGFSVKNEDPLTRIDNTTIAAQVGPARAFYANDRFGDSYLGLAASRAFVDREQVNLTAGGVVGIRDFSFSEAPGGREQSTFIHLAAQGSLYQPIIRKITPGARFKIQAEEQMALDGTMSKASHEKDPNFQSNLSLKGGVRASAEGGRLKADAYAGVLLPLSPVDIRGTRIIVDGLVPQFQHVELSTDVRMRLTPNDVAYAGVVATVLCGQLGCRGKAELYSVYQNVAASVAFEGRMNSEMPGYVEGTQRRVSGQLRAQFEKYGLPLWISIRGDHSLDTGINSVGASMGGSL